MSVLVDKNTRLVVQGITGSAGAFHTRQCMDYGTNVVAGVTPGKGGQMFEGQSAGLRYRLGSATKNRMQRVDGVRACGCRCGFDP